MVTEITSRLMRVNDEQLNELKIHKITNHSALEVSYAWNHKSNFCILSQYILWIKKKKISTGSDWHRYIRFHI